MSAIVVLLIWTTDPSSKTLNKYKKSLDLYNRPSLPYLCGVSRVADIGLIVASKVREVQTHLILPVPDAVNVSPHSPEAVIQHITQQTGTSIRLTVLSGDESFSFKRSSMSMSKYFVLFKMI